MAEGANIGAGADGDASLAAQQRAHKRRMRRLFWMTQARVWHWISGAATLIGMALFAFTGITLNHAGQIEGKPQVEVVEAVMPSDLLAELASAKPENGEGVLPGSVVAWLSEETGAPVSRRSGEWNDLDVYVGMPRPGGDAWLSVDLETGDVIYEATDRGVISWLNDLHKGRNTGPVWFWFLDIFSVACLIFCISGLILLWMHAERRPPTWFIVGAGLAVPAVIAIFLLHI